MPLPSLYHSFRVSFLKIILKSTLYELLQGKLYLLFQHIHDKNFQDYPEW